jgi:hypothetical protein
METRRRTVGLALIALSFQLFCRPALATPYCTPPEDPQVFPGSGGWASSYPLGPSTLGAGCPIHLLAKTALSASDLALRDDTGDLPFTFTEEATVVSTYPVGYDCDCTELHATDSFHHYTLTPSPTLPSLASFSLFKKGGASELQLADFTIHEMECDPDAGKTIKVLCSTCDKCGPDPQSPDAQSPGAAGKDGGGEVDGTPLAKVEPGGCSLACGSNASTLPASLLLLFGIALVWVRRPAR